MKCEDFELFTDGTHFTDDTVMTVAVADAILYNNTSIHNYFDYLLRQKEYAVRFKYYYRRYPYAGFGNMFENWAVSPSLSRQKSYANGGAMRV